jgi:hypothetical protein
MNGRSINLLPGLTGDTQVISLNNGGRLNMCLNAGQPSAGMQYLLLGSLSGSSPGLPLGLGILPLNFDSWLIYTISNPNIPPYAGTFGPLGASGNAMASFTLPALLPPFLHGLKVTHAYTVLDPFFRFVDFSNPIEVTLLLTP